MNRSATPFCFAVALTCARAPADTLGELEAWLSTERGARPALAAQDFAVEPLSEAEATAALDLLWRDHLEAVRAGRKVEFEAKEVRLPDGPTMRYLDRTFGDKPEGGRSLWISMHGGGNAPPQVNDGQWRNQIRLYRPEEGIYLAPRAPGDTWDLWHTADIDPLFDRLIENFVALADVDPNKVYLMGYSAGGDGVYQLAPRMSDRFAAAAMMAGHPNETSPLGLRNIPFALQVGALDGGFKRNAVAAEWGERLAELHEADPGGYEHFYRLREGKPHWMDLLDAEAVPWMAKFERRRWPEKIVWVQDNVTHRRLYWLGMPEGVPAAKQKVVAARDGQTITIAEAAGANRLELWLSDAAADLDQPIKVLGPGGEVRFEGKVQRTVATLAESLEMRPDRELAACARVEVEVE